MNSLIDRFTFRCHGWSILGVHDGKFKVTGIASNRLRTNFALIWCVALNCWTIHGRKLLRCRPTPICLFTRDSICRYSPCKRDGLGHIIIMGYSSIRINIMNSLIDRFTFRCHDWDILGVHDGEFKVTRITSNRLRWHMLQIWIRRISTCYCIALDLWICNCIEILTITQYPSRIDWSTSCRI